MSENNTESSSIDQNSHIPRQMLSEIVYKQKMFHSKSKFSWFIITKSCKLYELKDKMILKSCKLKENCEVFETDLISIKTYFRKTKCIYLIQLNQQLLVLEDGNMFTLKNTFENVLDYQIKAINDTEKVVINLKNKSTPIITDCSISSVDVDTDNDANNSFIMKSVFVDVLNSMRNKITESKIELKTLQLFMKQFFNQNIREMRFGRNGAVTDFPDEKIPLVKYGDVWTKIHNDKLVIGIPLLNCTYGSRINLYNIRPILVTSATQSNTYTYNLYKLQCDSYTFEEFDKLVNEEFCDDITYPKFNHEWIICKNHALSPGTSAVLIITQPIISYSYTKIVEDYKCYILFDVHQNQNRNVDGIENTTNGNNKKQIFIGNLVFNPNEICCRPEGMINFKTDEIYKDVLTIVATSVFVKLKLKFSKNSSAFERFLLDRLQFVCLKKIPLNQFAQTMMDIDSVTENSVTMDAMNSTNREKIQICYNDGILWRNTLIRLDYPSNYDVDLKIYARADHQIITFIRMIVIEYGNKCRLVSCKSSDEFNLNLKTCLKQELNYNIEFCKEWSANESDNLVQKFIDSKFLNEMKSDVATTSSGIVTEENQQRTTIH